MKRIKPQHFLILLLVAAIAAAPFLIRGLIDRSSVGKQPAAAVTAAPEETAEPTPTPEPTPLQFTTVDASYFDDALFIGDSRTVGIAEYGSLKKRMREYDAVKQNIDSILSPNRGQEQDKAL